MLKLACLDLCIGHLLSDVNSIEWEVGHHASCCWTEGHFSVFDKASEVSWWRTKKRPCCLCLSIWWDRRGRRRVQWAHFGVYSEPLRDNSFSSFWMFSHTQCFDIVVVFSSWLLLALKRAALSCTQRTWHQDSVKNVLVYCKLVCHQMRPWAGLSNWTTTRLNTANLLWKSAHFQMNLHPQCDTWGVLRRAMQQHISHLLKLCVCLQIVCCTVLKYKRCFLSLNPRIWPELCYVMLQYRWTGRLVVSLCSLGTALQSATLH